MLEFHPLPVRQWVVVFPKRVRYFLNVDAGCLNRVAGIAMSEVQRATAGAATSTAQAARSGGVLFVHRFGATLNAHVHLHLCMVDGGWRDKPGSVPHTAKIQLESAGAVRPLRYPRVFTESTPPLQRTQRRLGAGFSAARAAPVARSARACAKRCSGRLRQ